MPNIPIYEALAQAFTAQAFTAQAFAAEGVDTHFTLIGHGKM